MPTIVSMSDYLEQKLADHVFNGVIYTPPAAVYLTYTSTAPTDAGGGTEAAGSGFARQELSFEVAGTTTARRANTDADAVFTMPAGTFPYVKIMDAATDGNMLWWGLAGDDTTDIPVTTTAGQQLTVAAGALGVRFADVQMTDYLAHELLDHHLRSEAYSPAASIEMGLYEGAVEKSGGTYARQTISYGLWAGGQVANDAPYAFQGLPLGDYDGARLHEDAASGGNALWVYTYPTISLPENGRLNGAIGSSTVKLDS